VETKNVKVNYETWKTLKRFATENDKSIIEIIKEEVAKMANEERCPVCGEKMVTKVWVRNFAMCRKCAGSGNVETALKIARSKHKDKLEKIWTELNKEEE